MAVSASQDCLTRTRFSVNVLERTGRWNSQPLSSCPEQPGGEYVARAVQVFVPSCYGQGSGGCFSMAFLVALFSS